jgi:hypothetical protein
VVGSELFWGADATQMAVDYVAAGCHFDDPEFARVAQLPIGAERKDVTPKPAPGRKGRTRIVGTAT